MIDFDPIPGCEYKWPYHEIFANLAKVPAEEQIRAFRTLIAQDLFFVLYFVMGIEVANKPFVVQMCKDVESGTCGWRLDLWARYHFKSSIITKAHTIQTIVNHPNECTMIASHTRPMAKKFLRSIMHTLENSDILKQCFPEIFYDNPRNQAPKWSEDDGIIVRRSNVSRGESTVEAHGIKEGMPISVHFDHIKLDDLETKDDVKNPETVVKVQEAIDLSQFLLTENGDIWIIGTPYSHAGVYIPYIRDLKKAKGEPRYEFHKHPCVDENGKPVMVTEEKLEDIRMSMTDYNYNCQMLIDPTPTGKRPLDSEFIKEIEHQFIPKNCYTFMTVDTAGDDETTQYGGDAWAINTFAVDPNVDDLGASNVYLKDCYIEPLSHPEAITTIADMYMKAGLVAVIGFETSLGANFVKYFVDHVINALAAKGRNLDAEKRKNLMYLSTRGRSKESRILGAVALPLKNGNFFVSKKIPEIYRDRIKQECDNFPHWKDDFLDGWAYLYDILHEYNFAKRPDEAAVKQFLLRNKYKPISKRTGR